MARSSNVLRRALPQSAQWQRYLLNVTKLLAGTAGNQAIAVLLLPVMTRAMSPAEVGTWDLLQFIFSLSVVALLLESGSIIAKRLVALSDDPAQQAQELSAALQLMAITSAIFVVVYFAGAWRLIAAWLPDTGDLLLQLLPWAVIANMFHQQLIAFAQHVGLVGRATLYGVVTLALNLSLGILLIVEFRLGVLGLVISKLAANGLGFALCLHLTRRWLRRGWWLSKVPGLLRASLPLVPYALSFFVLTYGDRVILRGEVSFRDIGIYAVASRINLVAFAVFFTFTTAYVFEYHRIRERLQDQSLRKLTIFSAAAICIVVLSVSELAVEVVRFLAPAEYHEAAALVPWLLIGQGCFGILSLLWIELVARENTWVIGATSGVAAAANILLNVLLVPRYGIAGAAVAQLLAYLLLLAIATTYLHRRRLLISGAPGGLLLLAATSAVISIERLLLQLPLLGRLMVIVAVVALAFLIVRRLPGSTPAPVPVRSEE